MSLTAEDIKKLSAPLAKSALRERKGQGGKTFTYADLDYLERRVGEVDPDWQIDFREVGTTGIVCAVRILGVQRSATAGYYIPDTYQVWDADSRSYKERKMTAEVAHTIVTRAQAAAERRAFAMFGLGAELWNKEAASAEDEDERPARKSSGSGSSQSSRPASRDAGSGSGLATPKQVSYLGDAFLVPARVAEKLTGGREGTASALIDALRNVKDEPDYEKNPNKYIEKALRKVAPKLVSLLEEESEVEDDFEDDDED